MPSHSDRQQAIRDVRVTLWNVWNLANDRDYKEALRLIKAIIPQLEYLAGDQHEPGK